MADVSHNAGPVERVVELHLPSRLGYEKVAMDAAASLARRMGFSADRVDAYALRWLRRLRMQLSTGMLTIRRCACW